MPIACQDTAARVDGVCTVEEALDFAEWLRGNREVTVDLSTCSHLHSALLQCLMAFRPPMSAPPPDEFLAGCLDLLPRATPPVRKRKTKTRVTEQ